MVCVVLCVIFSSVLRNHTMMTIPRFRSENVEPGRDVRDSRGRCCGSGFCSRQPTLVPRPPPPAGEVYGLRPALESAVYITCCVCPPPQLAPSLLTGPSGAVSLFTAARLLQSTQMKKLFPGDLNKCLGCLKPKAISIVGFNTVDMNSLNR